MEIEFSVLISKEFDDVEDINDTVYNLCGWYPYVVRIKFDMKGRENIEDVVYIKYNELIDSRKWGWLPITFCDSEDNSTFKRMNNIKFEFDNNTISC